MAKELRNKDEGRLPVIGDIDHKLITECQLTRLRAIEIIAEHAGDPESPFHNLDHGPLERVIEVAGAATMYWLAKRTQGTDEDAERAARRRWFEDGEHEDEEGFKQAVRLGRML